MKVLVIGGTYFLGRVFTMLSHQDYDLTLVNRGNYSMQQYGVKEYHFDRHDKMQWQKLTDDYDVIVDFCAYQKGDIETVIQNLAGSFQHYIFISTVDVYQRGTGQFKDETHPLEYRHFAGEMGDYIYSKVLLEQELEQTCLALNKNYTSLRPGQIYGPFNYAPRESELIKRVINALPLVNIIDAKACFQLVYVKDVVKAIQLIMNQHPKQHAFNIVNSQYYTYTDVNQSLSQCTQEPIQIIDQTIQEAQIMNYPLIYPLYEEEMELYNGHLIESLGFTYTSLDEGMSKTYQAFYPIYKK